MGIASHAISRMVALENVVGGTSTEVLVAALSTQLKESPTLDSFYINHPTLRLFNLEDTGDLSKTRLTRKLGDEKISVEFDNPEDDSSSSILFSVKTERPDNPSLEFPCLVSRDSKKTFIDYCSIDNGDYTFTPSSSIMQANENADKVETLEAALDRYVRKRISSDTSNCEMADFILKYSKVKKEMLRHSVFGDIQKFVQA